MAEKKNPSKLRIIVRTASTHRDYPRYRASLGPFTRTPVEVEATPEQVEALRADPALMVTEVGGKVAKT